MHCQPALAELRELIDRGLAEFLPKSDRKPGGVLYAAMRYGLFPGGKRLRPMLTLLAGEMAGGTFEQALPAACAIEFLHTASLIIDDLPCMDDERERRGKQAVHVQFGDDVAILAALALLNQSYAIFASSAQPRLTLEAVRCIGVDGMIGGQALDLRSPAANRSDRYRKTSALMRLTLTAGAIACNAPPRKVSRLAVAGEALGEAYQIWDDLADGLGSGDIGLRDEDAERELRRGRAVIAAEFERPGLLLDAIDHMAFAMRQRVPAVPIAAGPAGVVAQV